jgi:ubiquinone biosynthesis protein UbiJ
MIHALHQTKAATWLNSVLPAFNAAIFERVTLLINHVIGAEPEAMVRLRPHAGSTVQVVWQVGPAWLPKSPGATWQVTPAGLFEWTAASPSADAAAASVPVGALRVTLDAKALARWGLDAQVGPPPMALQGDAAFAATMSWVAEHVRWDVEDDLARIVGDVPARWLGRLGAQFSALLRRLTGRGAA